MGTLSADMERRSTGTETRGRQEGHGGHSGDGAERAGVGLGHREQRRKDTRRRGDSRGKRKTERGRKLMEALGERRERRGGERTSAGGTGEGEGRGETDRSGRAWKEEGRGNRGAAMERESRGKTLIGSVQRGSVQGSPLPATTRITLPIVERGGKESGWYVKEAKGARWPVVYARASCTRYCGVSLDGGEAALTIDASRWARGPPSVVRHVGPRGARRRALHRIPSINLVVVVKAAQEQRRRRLFMRSITTLAVIVALDGPDMQRRSLTPP